MIRIEILADDEVWLMLAKQRLHPIPEYNENLAYILEDEDFVMDIKHKPEEMEGQFETGKGTLDVGSDLEVPLRELGELKQKAKNVTEALR